MSEIDENLKFVRSIEVDCCNVDLKFIQHSIGDVGCVVWDAGIVLGKYLDHRQNLGDAISNNVTIEVGSGTGVAGLFAAALGAKVILTDLPEVIPILSNNIEVNRDVLKGSATASILSWGEENVEFPVPDIILASDCIYYDMSVQKLVPTLVKLAGLNTELLISYEDRDLGNKKELLKSFLTALKKYFTINVIHQSEHHPDYQSQDIHILKCKKLLSCAC